MARLNLKAFASDTRATDAVATDADDSDNDNDELPDLCTLLKRLSHHSTHSSHNQSKEGVNFSGVKKSEARDEAGESASAGRFIDIFDENQVGMTAKSTTKVQREIFIGGENSKKKKNNGEEEKSVERKQLRPLRLAHVNSLLLLPMGRCLGADVGGSGGDDVDEKERSNRIGGLRGNGVAKGIRDRVEKGVPSRISISSLSEERGEEATDGSSDDLSDFIVNDSASEFDEAEVPRIRIPKELKHASSWKDGRAGVGGICPIPDSNLPKLKISPTKSISGLSLGGIGRHIHAEPRASLKLSSPPLRDTMSHIVTNQENPMITPPSTPPKPKLPSPSKKLRIPPSPHRPSGDAFWSNEVINGWNDKHSPPKEFKFNREKSLCPISDDDPSFPPPSLPLSPSKRNQPEIQRRKKFDLDKHELASSFVHQLDQKITNGQISSLASSTGGIHIVWSNKLKSTAGQAHRKEEPIFSESSDGVRVKTGCRYHAKIELAEKIIINEDRLFNVVAHEFCHLATFMISRVKNKPHGREFKCWGRKITAAFPELSIRVTTRHSYDITYKYVWACTSPQCSYQHKRHSKSIDPKRHACGKCRSPLVQIKPTPRATNKDNEGENRVGRTAWQDYVKANLARVREETPGQGMKAWMEEMGRRFREERRGKDKDQDKDQDKKEETAEKGKGYGMSWGAGKGVLIDDRIYV